MLGSLSYDTIIHYVQAFFDILLVWIILVYLIRIIRNNQKTVQIFQGIIVIVLIQVLSELLGLKTLNWISSNFISWGLLAIIVIFQPEIRSLLERIGKSNAFARISSLTGSEKTNLINQIILATSELSKSKTGALITLEQATSLNDFIKTGITINSNVTAELLLSIFTPKTPLHDGAVIIQGDRIACAAAYFSPTTKEIGHAFGSRHRAALGISEITDSITIVVSEETGRVSVAQNSHLVSVDELKLRGILEKIILDKQTIKQTSNQTVSSASVGIENYLDNGETDFVKPGSDLLNRDQHQMKTFQTQTFKTIESNNSIVNNVMNNAVNENKLDASIKVNHVASSQKTQTNVVTSQQNKGGNQ